MILVELVSQLGEELRIRYVSRRAPGNRRRRTGTCPPPDSRWGDVPLQVDPFALLLEGDEEVSLVPDDGTAEAAAVGLAAEGRLLDSGCLGQIGLGVDGVVAQEEVDPALELVGAGLGEDVDRAADAAAVLGRELVADEHELPHDVLLQVDPAAAHVLVVVVHPIDGVGVVALEGAGNGVACALSAYGDAGREQQQIRRISSVEREALRWSWW